jgi:hypothetical protein
MEADLRLPVMGATMIEQDEYAPQAMPCPPPYYSSGDFEALSVGARSVSSVSASAVYCTAVARSLSASLRLLICCAI